MLRHRSRFGNLNLLSSFGDARDGSAWLLDNHYLEVGSFLTLCPQDMSEGTSISRRNIVYELIISVAAQIPLRYLILRLS